MKWTNLIERPKSSNASPTTVFGVSYLMGYQLYKETIPTWVIPEEWIENRNARRVLPEGMGVDRFVSISDSQNVRTNAIVRRMIVSQR